MFSFIKQAVRREFSEILFLFILLYLFFVVFFWTDTENIMFCRRSNDKIMKNVNAEAEVVYSVKCYRRTDRESREKASKRTPRYCREQMFFFFSK